MNTTNRQKTACTEFKGSLFTLSVLKLLRGDFNELDEDLALKTRQAPQFFQYTPIVIDLENLDPGYYPLDFKVLKDILQKHKLIPVGIKGRAFGQSKEAQAAGFAILSDAKSIKKGAQKANETPKKGVNKIAASPSNSKLITTPVRSGQQIYAQDSDLIVTAPVSPGAELLADGHIHVYGPLRGRVLAGVNGNIEARIFCQKMEAELVSIAGQYRVFEDIELQDDNCMHQLFLKDGQLVFSSL